MNMKSLAAMAVVALAVTGCARFSGVTQGPSLGYSPLAAPGVAMAGVMRSR